MCMHMCLLLVITEDLKCTGEYACVNGCSTVSTWESVMAWCQARSTPGMVPIYFNINLEAAK